MVFPWVLRISPTFDHHKTQIKNKKKLNMGILLMFEGTFLLEVAQIHVGLSLLFFFSPCFQKLINVLLSLTPDERKAFLQFTTGCSSLPPGGLANLHPRLTIVRKVDGDDKSFPSVNTCVHYLKLPEYSTEEILRERLLAATKEKGFHLN